MWPFDKIGKDEGQNTAGYSLNGQIANVANLEEILENLDDSLTGKLNELRAETDADKKAALSEAARASVRKMMAYAGSDSLMQVIDDQNGFMPLTIQARVSSALTEVLATI